MLHGRCQLPVFLESKALYKGFNMKENKWKIQNEEQYEFSYLRIRIDYQYIFLQNNYR